MRIAINQLASGAQTDDVETAVRDVARRYGIRGVQAAITFSMISISHDTGTADPITMLHFVRDRTVDFDRLAATAALVRAIRSEPMPIAAAEAELDAIEEGRSAYGRFVTFVAPAVSAAASTIVFGGDAVDGLATFADALLIQPALAAIGRTSLPPFFRVGFGAAASALLVALLVGLGMPIIGGLVLTGSLLRFLPGYALVSGFRDLVGQSVMSGTARLAEALLLGAAVAGGTALALAIAESAQVYLFLVIPGAVPQALLVVGPAALVAVGAYAVQLGVPRRSVLPAALLGAAGWLVYLISTGLNHVDAAVATFAAAIAIGAIGRLLARWQTTPAALYVVPAVLPLLPGLTLVQAMLAQADAARVSGLIDATAAAFLIGVGVAIGDIVVATVRTIREQVVAPAVDAVAGNVEVLVINPVGRVIGAALPHADRAAAGEAAGDDDDPRASDAASPPRRAKRPARPRAAGSNRHRGPR
jgi:uncharacterized membrane protein YjjP (DUF1212 family)